MARCYAAGYANPASQHQPGQQARRVWKRPAERMAEILGADLNRHKPDRLVFTSGGTEANNLAISASRGQPAANAPGQSSFRSIEHA